MAKGTQQPVYIVSENTRRSSGREAQRNNIMAAKLVAETVRTTLGPKGMDKMLVSSLGDIIVTNDGVTILEEMQIEHPGAKMVVEVAKTQENEVGDGTTTAVILAGELLKNAEILLDKEIHPTVIIKGYRVAAEKAQIILEQISENINEDNDDELRAIAATAMVGKAAESAKDKLSLITLKAVKQVLEKKNNKIKINSSNIKLEKKIGAGINDSELIQGIIIDKEKLHSAMPDIIKDARIALIDSALEIKSPETDTKVQIDDPNKMQAFLEMEEKILKDMVEKIKNSGANVVLCQKGIDDLVQHYLAKHSIYAARRIKKSDMESIAKATNATIITKLNDLTERDLGKAGIVEARKVGDEDMTYIGDCIDAKAVTILIRGGTEHVIDEVERAVKDAIGDVSAALELGKVVAGAGSTELELAKEIRNFSTSLSGREQLAVQAFADALESIPITLAENAGLDPIDTLTELKASHEKGEKWAGLNVFSGKTMNAWSEGVLEPLKIKTQAIKSASEVAELILRIDDVLAASASEKSITPNPEMM